MKRWLALTWLVLFAWAQSAPAAVSPVPSRPSHPAVCCCKKCSGNCGCLKAPGPAGQPLTPAIPAGHSGLMDGLAAPDLASWSIPATPVSYPPSSGPSLAGQFSEPRCFVRFCAWLI